MRVAGITAYKVAALQSEKQNSNVNFGRFMDDKADAISKAKLCEADYETIRDTDDVFVRSEGDTLQVEVNPSYLKQLSERYRKMFDEGVDSEDLVNAHEGYKLQSIASTLCYVGKMMRKDALPKKPDPTPEEVAARDARNKRNREIADEIIFNTTHAN